MSAIHQPSCCVVVCTRDRPDLLRGCLAGIRRSTYPSFEVLVVDSCSTRPGTQEAALEGGARYLRVSRPGLSHARNEGVRNSTAEVLAFMDDDAVPHPEWLTHLVKELADPGVMAVTARVVPPEDAAPDERRISGLIEGFGASPAERKIVDSNHPAWFEMTNFGGMGAGILAARREAFTVVPGFDERLGRGTFMGAGEENYLFFQLVDRGYRVVFQPAAFVWHPMGRPAGQLWDVYLGNCSAATAYLSFLFFEQPRYRRTLIHYVRGAVAGRRREWRAAESPRRPSPFRRFDVLAAYLRGPLAYARTRLRTLESPTSIRLSE